VPENAVVVPGSRAVNTGTAAAWNLSLYSPVIVKYATRDGSGIKLEEWLTLAATGYSTLTIRLRTPFRLRPYLRQLLNDASAASNADAG